MKAFTQKFLLGNSFGRWIFKNLLTVQQRAKVLYWDIENKLLSDTGLTISEIAALEKHLEYWNSLDFEFPEIEVRFEHKKE